MPDTGYWYTYLPLKQLGHEVYWYDTVDPDEKDYNKIVETFKPDLIFCCMTGNPDITPYEPWQSIKKETDSGRIKTFNWFCDDTWRFEGGSDQVCKLFSVCSTPEPTYIQKYKEIGYSNIILGNWHANSEFYPVRPFAEKDIEISFIGAPNPARNMFFDSISAPVQRIFGISQEEVFEAHARTKIGINLSFNDNDPQRKTQMKQRIFEVPAGAGLLFTEYHAGIEEFFEIDKEVVTFKTFGEFSEKANFLLKNPKVVERIAKAGHQRFLTEHDSKIRLANILEQIRSI